MAAQRVILKQGRWDHRTWFAQGLSCTAEPSMCLGSADFDIAAWKTHGLTLSWSRDIPGVTSLICILKMAGSVFRLRLKGSLGNHFLTLTFFFLNEVFGLNTYFPFFYYMSTVFISSRIMINPLHVSRFS